MTRRRRKPHRETRVAKAFADHIAFAVGNWYCFALCFVIAAGWWLWDRLTGATLDNLNFAVSIWTMQLDILVLIAANRNSWLDRDNLVAIRALEQEILRETKEIGETLEQEL